MGMHKVAVTLTEDGTLSLSGLPFQAGDTVEIVLSGQSEVAPKKRVQQKVSQSVADIDYLKAVSDGMTEWTSEADDVAYQNL